MEIPLEYIITNIMIFKKSRLLESTISKKDLSIIINEIIQDIDIDNKDKKELIRDFDLDYEIDYFISDSCLEYYLENDILICEASLEELDYVNAKLENSVDDQFYDSVTDLLYGNMEVMALLGIKVRKDIYAYLKNIFNELMENHYLLEKSNNKEEIIKKIKILHLKQELCFLNMNNTLDINDYDDLVSYAGKITSNVPKCRIPLNIPNEEFQKNNLYYNPLERTIFLGHPQVELLLNLKLESEYYGLSPQYNNSFEREFYLEFYYLLEEEINNTIKKEDRQRLVTLKYELMYLIDTMFKTDLFIGKRPIVNKKEKINFFQKDVFYLIEEVLSYNDNIYSNDKEDTIRCYNIIKKLYIKTYYQLTSDSEVIDKIKTNELYNINMKSTKLLDEIIPNNKTKTKEL